MSHTKEGFDETSLQYVLPIYYKRIFPFDSLCRWLSYGSWHYFEMREFTFVLQGDRYVRYLSFDNNNEFAQKVKKKNPIKIDIGAVYNMKPSLIKGKTTFFPEERELIFDIDLTDYDDIRSCCSGADICRKCWKFMVIACKVLDAALREDFGFKHLLWIFSGRRGIHCWVCDKAARVLDSECREAVAGYLVLLEGGAHRSKKVNLPDEHLHTSIQRALRIIDSYFEEDILRGQDIIGTDERLRNFLQIIDDDIRPHFDEVLSNAKTTVGRWNAFVQQFDYLLQRQIPKHLRNLKEEIKLQYSYPRLDYKVSIGMNHLLKSPFSVHPKTGKISVPFNQKLVDRFDPISVPTITSIMDEVNAYDAKTMEQESSVSDITTEESVVSRNIKDIKKTSLLKPVTIFNEFVKQLEKEWRKKDTQEYDVAMEF
ncbi:DNA primase small subunit isoform X2 [Agrilus planipennis]|uniref:DNA primase n=1 Tax=Agrilus planipennis TaxID=224129 RepID=A0A1W4WQC8_AGRPL|nr:DNA primase small subunit isoform X2 [Agrilus planipennis]